MTERVLGPTGSPRRRWTLLLPFVVAIALGLFYITGAQAVHDYSNGMQLDGDVSNACPPAPDTGVCVSTQADWADFFDVSNGTTTPKSTLPNTDFKKAVFIRDFESGTNRNNCTLTSAGTTFCTGDLSTFATGSKDELDIANGGWQCNRDNNVNSKIDIMNAYTASYTASNGDKIMYFGLEKNKDNGTNDVGFWFLQGAASCTAPSSGAANWTGSNHTLGDVLVVSEFSSGGGVSNITAYKWVGGQNPLSQIATATGTAGDCKTNLGQDNLCATTNSGAKKFNTTLTTPWLTSDATLGVGKSQIVPPDFFEGGINLTEAFKDSGGGTAPSCFNTFVGDTRSSKETSATLFDYASGQLGECSINVVTTPSQTTRVLGSTDPITDTADISGTTTGGGTAPTPTGKVSFFLCGPGVTTCASPNGAPVPSSPAQQVTLGACSPPVAGHACATSADAKGLITGVGTYCFRAVYDPGTDPNYQGKGGSFTAAGECFTVTGVATLATRQRWLPNDSAQITGPGALSGTATFTLYNDLTCGAGTGTAQYTQQVAVSGTNSVNVATSNTTFHVTANNAGTAWSWKVSYTDAVLGAPTDRCEKTSAFNITD